MLADALSQHDIKRIKQLQRRLPKPNLSHLPGNSGLPLIGHTYDFLTDLHSHLNNNYQKYGKVFRQNTGFKDSVVLLEAEANRLVYKNDNKLFSNFLAWNEVFERLFDNNLLERDFGNHKYHRKILQLAFKRNSIESHIEIMNPLIRTSIAHWSTGRPIKIMDHVKSLLLNVGANVFLGVKIGKETQKLNQAFIDAVEATTDPLRLNIPFTTFGKGVRGRKTLSKFILNNIDNKRLSSGSDIFSQICRLTDDEGNQFSDGIIRDHIIFLLFAAHDTTTSALCSVLHSLAFNPKWQEEVRDEVMAFNKEHLDFEDLDTMHKTGWTFKEALRMYPPLCIMPRKSLRAFEYDGHEIPANTTVAVSPLFTHYMKEYWSQPTVFDPMRFAPGREEDKQDFYQYIPFGGGAHKCLGLHFAEVQGKLFLFHLLRHYRVSMQSKKPYKYKNVPLTFPTNGLPLTLQCI